MASAKRLLLLVFLASCSTPWPLKIQQADMTIPFVPKKQHQWPLWPMTDGWLVGGSGFRFGYGRPDGVTPGVGLGAIWLPNIPSELRPAPVPKPKPSPSGSPALPSKVGMWSKIGPVVVPLPAWPKIPDGPWVPTVWGPIALIPGPLPADDLLIPLGFPPADGTPETQSALIPFIRSREGLSEVVVYDRTSATLFPVPAILPAGAYTGVSRRGNMLLVSGIDTPTPLQLIDLLTGGIDAFPELTDIAPGFGGNPTIDAEFIGYTAGRPGALRVHLFDRRTRHIDRLAHLDVPGNHINPSLDGRGRLFSFLSQHEGTSRVLLYDTITALVDQLPEINRLGPILAQNLDDSGRWLVFIVDIDGIPQVQLFDFATRGIDPLPDLNALGPFTRINITGDGFIIYGSYFDGQNLRGVLYDRPTGFINPLPAVNLPGYDVRI